MKNKLYTLFSIFCTVFFIQTIFAQESEQSLLDEGLSLMRDKKYSEAVKVLKKAVKQDSSGLIAIRALGEIALERQDWGDARGYFKKLAEKDPDDLDARYHLGICYREIGKSIDPVRRLIAWKNSEKHLKHVIASDSLFKDAIFQLAKLQRYRQNYKDAVILTETQLALKDELTEVQVRVYRYYDYVLENYKKKDIESWLQSQKFPRAKYFLGDFYRRNNKLKKAQEIFNQLLDENISYSYIPINLSLVRLYLQKDNQQKAEQYYWQAIQSITNKIDAKLVFEDIKYLFTDKELYNYDHITDAGEMKQFFSNFWQNRNPLPAASENLRLTEHYIRMLKVEKYYRYDGFRSWVNNPDKLHVFNFPSFMELNDKFNDKGLIYIRHGEPDDVAYTLGASTQNNESWLYYENGNLPKLMFHFVIAEHAGGNNWRLTSEIDPSWALDRINWDNIFFRYYNASVIEMFALNHEMELKCKNDAELGLQTDRHTWPKDTEPVQIPFYTALFKGENDKNVLELYYGIPRSSLKSSKSGIGETGILIQDSDQHNVYQNVLDLNLTDLIKNKELFKDFYINEWRTLLPSGKDFNIAFHYKVKGTPKIGAYKFKQKTFTFGSSELVTSNIVMAYAIEPSQDKSVFTKNGLQIIPNPTRIFERKNPVYLYYEIYNLATDDDNNSHFTVQHKITLMNRADQNLFSKVTGLFSKSQEEVSISTEREGNSSISIEHLALDLSSLASGEYSLTITISDLNSDATFKNTANFFLE